MSAITQLMMSYSTTSASGLIAATGGTILADGQYAIHTFNSSGTFTVTSGSGNIWRLIVGGGGGGGSVSGAGGGGVIDDGGYTFPVTTTSYSVTVGNGGTNTTSNAVLAGNGADSVFNSTTATGGGRGGNYNNATTSGGNGGSGGGAGTDAAGNPGSVGTGTSGQGSNGGTVGTVSGGYAGPGGGGASAVGSNSTGNNSATATGGAGGAGVSSSITGVATTYAGGGGGASNAASQNGAGGSGGGGRGASFLGGQAGVSGTANTGGGGGAGYGSSQASGSGGSGVVIARYKYTNGNTFSSTVVKQSSQFGSGGGTTASNNTTGCNLIVVVLTWHAGSAANLSDSKGNTWTALASQIDSNMGTKIYYCINPTVGSGHTFTTTSNFSGVNILALTSTGTPVYDQTTGAHANSSGNLQPGSLTPSTDGCVLVTGFGTFNGTAPAMPTNYTQIGSYTTATAEGGGAGYKFQAYAAAENPTWNSTGSSQCAVLASFKPG